MSEVRCACGAEMTWAERARHAETCSAWIAWRAGYERTRRRLRQIKKQISTR